MLVGCHFGWATAAGVHTHACTTTKPRARIITVTSPIEATDIKYLLKRRRRKKSNVRHENGSWFRHIRIFHNWRFVATPVP